ncbi:hypothetical protein MMC16_007001 [Acarospora aff. strigata]|nr:hypothetical protein [Acarospora aff. strigata]
MSCEKSQTETNIAIAALAVALTAFIATSGQLLGQYFATADGYRRCQPSVMGPWAKRTRLRWRWSQFRFETLFTTPEILLSSFDIVEKQRRVVDTPVDDLEWVLGSGESRERTMVTLPYVNSGTDEMACWLPLLWSLHRHEWELLKLQCYTGRHPISRLVGPAVRLRERSWDFMPPDIVRPHAITNVSDIAVLVRRLGMTWKDFRKTAFTKQHHVQNTDGNLGPEDGVMRAEGNGHVISSTFARSLGLILHYMYVGPASRRTWWSTGDLSKAELYIPCKEADMMGFGILAGFKLLRLPTFKMGTIDEVYATLNILDPSRKASRKVSDVRGIEPRCTFGFSDLIPLAAPMMHIHGCSVIRLPVPTEYCVGLTCHEEGFVIFYHRLQTYMAEAQHPISDQTTWVLQQYESLQSSYPEWENEGLANSQPNSRSDPFLEKTHRCWDAATEYFVTLHHTNRLRYADLVASHIAHAVNYWGDAWSRIREGKAREHYGFRDWSAEGMHLYWDYLPDIVAEMRRRGFRGDDELVYEAWITMMFRAFCWSRCHFLNPGTEMGPDEGRLPSRFWESKLPVFIG